MIRIYHARILTMQEDQEIFEERFGSQIIKYSMSDRRIKKKRQRSHGRDRLMQKAI